MYTFSRRDIEYDDVIENLDNLDEYASRIIPGVEKTARDYFNK